MMMMTEQDDRSDEIKVVEGRMRRKLAVQPVVWKRIVDNFTKGI